MKRIIAVILAFALLAGCADAPSEVQKENEVLDRADSAEYEEKEQSSTLVSSSERESSVQREFEYLTAEQIRAESEKRDSAEKYNISVKSVRVSEGQTMPVYKLKKYFTGFENIDGFIKEFYGEDVSANKSKLSWYKDGHSEFFPDSPDRYTVDTECKGALQYSYDEKGAVFASSSACGQFMANTPGCWEHQVAGGELVKTVDIAAGEKPDNTAYNMYDGGTVTVSRAVERAEMQVNKYIKMVFTDKMTCRVNKVEIMKMQDGAYGFQLYFEFADEQGNLYLTNQIYSIDNESFDNESKALIAQNIAVAWVFDSKERINYFCLNTIPQQSDALTDGKQLLSFDSALKCVHQKLAQSVLYDLDSAALEYVVTYPAKKGMIRRDTNGDLLGFDEREYLHRKDCDVYLRPCWVFRDYKKNDGHNSVLGGIIIVDAVTGDVTLY